MAWIDYAFLGLLAFGLAYGVWRGLVMLAAHVVGLVLAMLVAGRLSGCVGALLGAMSGWMAEHPWVASRIGHAVLFGLVFLAVQVLAYRFRGVLRKLRFGKWDRVLGGAVGFLAALLVCVTIALLLIPAEGDDAEGCASGSILMPYFARGIGWVRFLNSDEKAERVQGFVQSIRE